MLSVFTDEGYEAMIALVAAMTTDRLWVARRRALAVEGFRYRKELAGIDTPPAREKQIEIEIIERELRIRGQVLIAVTVA